MANPRPDTGTRIERRRRHRRELTAARRVAVLRAERRFRLTVVTLLGVGISLPWIVAGDWFDWGSKDDAEPAPASQTFEDLTIRGRLRIVDAQGRELAVLGQEGPEGPVVLGLSPDQDGGHGLRLASSPAGAAINLRAPAGDVTAGLMVTGSGPELEMRNGDQRNVLDAAPAAPPQSGGRALPAVAAGDRPVAGGDVDLALADVQAIGAGFMVARLEIERSPIGSVVRGRVINTTAVVHSGMRFRLALAGREADFQVDKVSPGNSTGFEVEIPGLFGVDSSRARLDYLGSTVSFANHSTTPEQGRVQP